MNEEKDRDKASKRGEDRNIFLNALYRCKKYNGKGIGQFSFSKKKRRKGWITYGRCRKKNDTLFDRISKDSRRWVYRSTIWKAETVERDLSSYLVDGSLKDLAFVSLARAHVRGGNQLGKLIDKQVLLVPSSFFVKALVTVNNQNETDHSIAPSFLFLILIYVTFFRMKFQFSFSFFLTESLFEIVRNRKSV